jgi:hypothetical protein
VEDDQVAVALGVEGQNVSKIAGVEGFNLPPQLNEYSCMEL